jgi:hypothetical protein
MQMPAATSPTRSTISGLRDSLAKATGEMRVMLHRHHRADSEQQHGSAGPRRHESAKSRAIRHELLAES